MNFVDKVVLVTGASSGIGAAIAKHFAAHGANVAIVGRNENKLKTVSQECEQNDCKPLVIIADVTKDDDVKKIVSNTVNNFGKLDILINNVGAVGSAKITSENAVQVFDKMIATNLRSVVYMTHLAVPHLIKTRGNIINISSVASSGVFSIDSFAYCASKAGLDHFTRCVALELAPQGIRVNTVNPGPVRSDILENAGASKADSDKMWNRMVDMTALNRISEPEEIADLVLFLASDKAKSITGSSYVTDNGTSLKGFFDNKLFGK